MPSGEYIRRLQMDNSVLSDWPANELMKSAERLRQDEYLMSDWGDDPSEGVAPSKNYDLQSNADEPTYPAYPFEFEVLQPGTEDHLGLVDYFTRAVRQNSDFSQDHPFTQAEFLKMRLFKLKGFDAGFALKPDGNIVAMHNHSAARWLTRALIPAAIERGGTKLDHFDGPLSAIYASLGFNVVKCEAWNDEYAPHDWKAGKPDTIYRSRG